MKPPGAKKITVVPTTMPRTNDCIAAWHRHHAPMETLMNGTVRVNKGMAWFCLAAVAEGEVVGVAMVGRPSNRNSDDGQTLEVHRVATNGTMNASSALLGACARTAQAMGASRIITYTLEVEPGTSLRAAGWQEEARGIETCWTKGKGKARPGGSGNTIWRPHMDVKKVRWAKHFRETVDVTFPEMVDRPWLKRAAGADS